MFKSIGFLLLATIIFTGCSMQPKSGPVADVGVVVTKVETAMSAGDTNAALDELSAAVKDKLYRRERAWLFGYQLNLLIMADRGDEAELKFLDTVGKDEELARAGFGLIYGHISHKGDPAALQLWVQKMMDSRLPKDMKAQAYSWQASLYAAAGQLDKIVALVPASIKNFDVAVSSRLVSEMVNTQIGKKNYDAAATILNEIEKNSKSIAQLKEYVAIQRVDLLFVKGDAKGGEDAFIATAPAIADGSLASWLARTESRCISSGQLDLAERLAEFGLKQSAKPSTKNVAAMQSIEVLKARKQIGAIPARINSLMDMGVSPETLFNIYRNEFYTIMGGNKKEDVVAMIAVGDKLEPKLASEDDKSQVRTMALDGTFITEDYVRSLKILEGGIVGRDKVWHEMAINKAKAHIALQEGKTGEAVEYFRKFMVAVAQWEKPEQDPISGVIYSKEMCLGLNARRIGDILTKAGDAQGAAASYTESKNYYDKALADVKPDTKEAEVIKQEVAKIPAK